LTSGQKNLRDKLNLGIIDYGACNIHSVYNSLYRLGEDPKIIVNYKEIKSLDKIIIPGVGSAFKSLESFKTFGFYDEILNFHQNEKPILGICLGFQIFSKTLYEDGVSKGLGFIDAEVIKLKLKKNFNIGWCGVKIKDETFKKFNLQKISNFYFCHSYYMKFLDQNEIKFSVGNIEDSNFIPSLYVRNNLMGCQFHPEKSQNTGKKILKYFINL
jgi:imidazole glycerol-phosphate synthase subunit HisH